MARDRETPGVEAAVPRIGRRDALKWLGVMLAGNALTPYPGDAQTAARDLQGAGHWPELRLAPVPASGYGQDPDLVGLTAGPWPRTLTEAQLRSVRVVADILIPREGDVPSAAELHVEDVVDEWVSAPYAGQRRDREEILPLLQWLDDESRRRFDRPFVAADPAERRAIVDDIAWLDAADPFGRPAAAFGRLRSIVVAAFFCTPEGSADLGYQGGKVIAGDYPGPTEEAVQHLEEMLADLGLDPVGDPAGA